MMKAVFGAVALALVFGSASAQAATRTFQAVFEKVTEVNGAFDAIGAADVSDMVFTWTYDSTMGHLGAMKSETVSGGERERALFPYVSFSVSVGGLTFTDLESDSKGERIYVRDGISGDTKDIHDLFSVGNYTLQTGPLGTEFKEISFAVWTMDETMFGRLAGDDPFSGLVHPDADTLDQMGDDFALARIQFTKPDGENARILGSDVTITELVDPALQTNLFVTPLPAGLPLMLAGVGAFAFLRRRQSRSETA